ncbi:MAG TPA: RloB family protein, partial [Defluviicoccus sp.]|nr:RloB family protein [Defluviicoccus sp.]
IRGRGAEPFAKNDEVWAVFDVDEHPNFHNAVQRCKDNGVGVGRSNPCFELWLILHWEDYDKGDGRRTVQERCQQVCPGYDKDSKTLDCTNLFQNVEAAIKRAEDQLARRKDQDNEFGCPSTTVGSLVQAILGAAARYRRGG